MSSDPEEHFIERNTIFVLTAILLTAIISIAFYNLDRHPAFPAPSDEFIEAVNDIGSPVVFADDPISMAVLQARQSDLVATTRPLTSWPPQAPLVTFGASPGIGAEDYEAVYEESVWTVWKPLDMSPLPAFDAATVEVEGADGPPRVCPREADGSHQCGDAGWTRVRERTLAIDGERERCIWAHPLPEQTLRIRFADIPALDSSEGRLRLQTGLSDDAVGTGTPVNFRVRLGTRSVTHRHDDRRGWQSTLLPTITEPSELQVEVWASDVGRRHICFRFDMR